MTRKTVAIVLVIIVEDIVTSREKLVLKTIVEIANELVLHKNLFNLENNMSY